MSFTAGDDPELDREVEAMSLAAAVAKLILSNTHASEHPMFFTLVEDELNKKNFTIECHQRGIHGTYVKLGRLP